MCSGGGAARLAGYSRAGVFNVIMPNMDKTETALRAIKDRVGTAIGEIEEASGHALRKENYFRLSNVARELHKCADEMQNILMRIRPR